MKTVLPPPHTQTQFAGRGGVLEAGSITRKMTKRSYKKHMCIFILFIQKTHSIYKISANFENDWRKGIKRVDYPR